MKKLENGKILKSWNYVNCTWNVFLCLYDNLESMKFNLPFFNFFLSSPAHSSPSQDNLGWLMKLICFLILLSKFTDPYFLLTPSVLFFSRPLHTSSDSRCLPVQNCPDVPEISWIFIVCSELFDFSWKNFIVCEKKLFLILLACLILTAFSPERLEQKSQKYPEIFISILSRHPHNRVIPPPPLTKIYYYFYFKVSTDTWKFFSQLSWLFPEFIAFKKRKLKFKKKKRKVINIVCNKARDERGGINFGV